MWSQILKSVIGPILGPIIDKIPDANERDRLRAEAEQNLLSAIVTIVNGQLEVNKTEAASASVFVSGWRPAIGWICGCGLMWEYVLRPMLVWVSYLLGADLSDAPNLANEGLMTILTGMLGLASLRTYEKFKGVARS